MFSKGALTSRGRIAFGLIVAPLVIGLIWAHVRSRRPAGQAAEVSTGSNVALAMVSGLSLLAAGLVWRYSSRRAGENLAAVIESVPDPFLVVDREYRVVLANKAARDACGRDPVKAGMRCHQVSHHGDAPCGSPDDPCPVQAVFETGKPVRVFHVHYNSTGQPRHVDVSASPILDGKGRVRYAVEVCRDLTNLQRAEEALRQSEERLRTLVQNAPVGIYRNTAGPKSRSLQANLAILKMFGFDSLEEFLTVDVADLYQDPEDRRRFIEDLARQGTVQNRELRLRRKDGTPIWGSVSTKAHYGPDGQVDWMDGVIQDITERKRAEEAARRETAKLAAMISGMDEGVVFADAANLIVETNDYFCRFVGGTRQDIVGRRLEEVHPPAVMQRIGQAVDRFRRNTGAEPLMLQRALAGREVILRMQPIYRDGAYDGVLLNVIDVTELVEARRLAEAASTAKSEFLANVSHEIRTPLTAILGYADLLGDPQLSAPQQQAHLDTIRRNGRHLLALINDILDLSKIEAGKMLIERQPCRVAAMVDDVAGSVRPAAERRGLRVDVEFATPIPEAILTDGARLRQALLNLVDNAVKFTRRGGVRIVVGHVPEWRPGRPGLAIEVIDTGVGIGPEAMGKLFQPFVQADTSTSRQYGGTGLGLAITRRIAELLGGDVTVQSVPGQGTTFTLTVPAEAQRGARTLTPPGPPSPPRPAPANGTPAEAAPLKGMRILLAEDGRDNQLLIGALLRKAGAQVDIAENGRSAVQKVMDVGAGYQVILMDMQMPEMDGYEAAGMLRRGGYAGAILALTAHAMAGDSEKSVAAGCNEHLTKPVDRALLIERILAWAGAEGAAAGGADGPIVQSELADDPELADILGEFVAGLPERVQAMRNALAHNALEELRRSAHQLKGAAGGYGYPSLTQAARGLEAAAKAGDAETARLTLARLADLCGAIVRGAPAGGQGDRRRTS